MEFPDLGQHCSKQGCNQLDFLPMKCDACEQIFCKDHFRYDIHKCDKAYLKDIQVPVCPLCNQPVPTKRGQQPDIEVGLHIDNDCQSEGACNKRRSGAIFTNKCSLSGCRQKEVVKITCSDCNRVYCLKHRHPIDHKCDEMSGKAAAPPAGARSGQVNGMKNRAGAFFLKHFEQRQKNENQSMASNKNLTSNQYSNQTQMTKAVQGNLSEDEALAKALQQSMKSEQKNRDKSRLERRSNEARNVAQAMSQEDEDRMLAEAIAASEREMHQNSSSGQKDKCCVS